MELYLEEDIRMEFPFLNQNQAKIAFQQKIQEFKNIFEMMKYANQQIPSYKIVKLEIPSFQQQNEQYKLKLQKMLTEGIKKYHYIIKHTSGLGKQKAGMIINILDLGENNFITNQKQINSECIKQLIIISDILKNGEKIEMEIRVKSKYLTCKLPTKKKKKIQCQLNGYFNYKWPLRGDKYEYYNKAISCDWTHLSIIREIWQKSFQQDISFMNLDNLKEFKYTLQMRIIPINKINPHIPTKGQMRPIIVMSHAIKMIEVFYEERLKEYVNLHINPEQVGFIQGIGTHIQIQEIVRYLSNRGIKGKTAIFIDLSNAYNMVDGDLLYQIMMKRKIFGDKALNFLFSLYDDLYFWDEFNKTKIQIKNGLHQGSIISTYLFDIYFDLNK